MAFEYKWINDGLEINFYETIDLKNIEDITKAILSHANYSKLTFVICSFEKVTESKLTILDAKVVGSLNRQATMWNDNLHIALVKTDKLSKLIPIYLTFLKMSKWNIQSFDTTIDAIAWLRDSNKFAGFIR